MTNVKDRMAWLRNPSNQIAPLSAKGLTWLEEQLEKVYPKDVIVPRLYSTYEGGVSIEWLIGSKDVTLDIDIDKHIGEWNNLDHSDDSSQDRTLDLNKEEDWEWVVHQIKNFGMYAGPEATEEIDPEELPF